MAAAARRPSRRGWRAATRSETPRRGPSSSRWSEGERPGAVTVAAVISTLLAVAISVQAVLSIAGVDAGDATTRPVPLLLFAVVLWAMAVGLWRARYWAVLGFQTVLVLMMLASAFGLVLVSSVLQAVGTTLLLLGSAALFYFMIRAMARIQMPSPPGAD